MSTSSGWGTPSTGSRRPGTNRRAVPSRTRWASSRASGSSTWWRVRRAPSTGLVPGPSTRLPTSDRSPHGRIVEHDRHVVRTGRRRRGRRLALPRLLPRTGGDAGRARTDSRSARAARGRGASGHVRHRRRPVSLYEIGVHAGRDHIDDLQRMELRRAFVGLVLGTIERDELNHLILDGGLAIRQVGVLRLYHRYLRQVGFRFSSSYTAHTLVRQAEIAAPARRAVRCPLRPARSAPMPWRDAAAADAVRTVLLDRLDSVPSLDEDRICRALLTLIDATVRTNAFRSRGRSATRSP